MEVDFSKTGAPATAAPVIDNKPAEAQPTPAQHDGPVASDQQLAPGGLLLGDKLPTFKEIILPRINLVQGSGQLKDRFPFGSIVFDAAAGGGSLLYSMPDIDSQTGNVRKPGTKPLVVTVLGFRPTRFAEKVEGGHKGMIVDTEELVRSNGGTLDYNEWKLKKSSGMKRFEYLADALVAIERPDHCADDDTVFVYTVDGKKYALAIWGMKGTAYTAAAKRVFFTARAMGCLKAGGYPSWSYSVSTRIAKQENNTYVVPVCLPNARSSPAFLEFVRGVIGSAE